MTNALSNVFSCTGQINTIRQDLQFGRVSEAEIRQRKGELTRLEGIHTELLALLTEDEKAKWKKGNDKTMSPKEMAKRIKQMDLENVDRDSI